MLWDYWFYQINKYCQYCKFAAIFNTFHKIPKKRHLQFYTVYSAAKPEDYFIIKTAANQLSGN